MAQLIVRIFTGIVLFTLINVRCDKTTEVVFSRMREIDRDIMDIRNKIVSDIDFAIAAFKTELTETIKQQVKATMAEMPQSESVEGVLQGVSREKMVRGKDVSELKRLKHGHHQLKRQLYQVMESLRDVQQNRETCVGSLFKDERNATEFLTCFNDIIEAKILHRHLEQCNEDDSHMRMEIQELKDSLGTLYKTCQSATATTEPPVEHRIILGPYYSNAGQQFRQLNIRRGTVNNYPYLNLKYALSLAFSSKLRKLFICLQHPDKLVSSSLDTDGVEALKYGVQAFGMAVDEHREVIFMAIHKPKKGIARMTTHGKHFSTVSHLRKYNYPWAIAVNAMEKKIYACDLYNVFMVYYDGRHMQTLVKGSNIFTITLDDTARNLYYGDDKKLKKISLSQNITSIITTVGSHMRSLVYYYDSVYFSRYSAAWINYTSVGQVDIGYESATCKPHPINITNVLGLVMCLVT